MRRLLALIGMLLLASRITLADPPSAPSAPAAPPAYKQTGLDRGSRLTAYWRAERTAEVPATQPAPTTLPAADIAHIADKVRTLLPKGWTAKVQDDRIDVIRDEAVEFYNGVSLPYFRTDADMKAYVKPNIRKTAFDITLRITKRMSVAEYDKVRDENLKAEKRGSAAIRNSGDLKTDLHMFLKEHPELGYRQLPTFYTEKYSIYLSVAVHPVMCFYSDEVGEECNTVVEHLNSAFRQYAEAPATPR